MSDSREGIEKLIGLGGAYAETAEIELRSHGWLHISDVVEGVEKEWYCAGEDKGGGEPDGCIQMCGEECQHYKTRTATVGDLIGKGGGDE